LHYYLKEDSFEHMIIPPSPGISWDAEADYEFWGAGELSDVLN
jgi:hypothetical protein